MSIYQIIISLITSVIIIQLSMYNRLYKSTRIASLIVSIIGFILSLVIKNIMITPTVFLVMSIYNFVYMHFAKAIIYTKYECVQITIERLGTYGLLHVGDHDHVRYDFSRNKSYVNKRNLKWYDIHSRIILDECKIERRKIAEGKIQC